MLQVSLSSGMSSGSMNGGVWIYLVGCVLGVVGVVYGGCDIGVVSMVLTLGWGWGWGWGVFVGLVCTTSRSSSRLLFSAGVFCL